MNGRMKFKILWIGWRNPSARRESDTILREYTWNSGAHIVSVLQFRGWGTAMDVPPAQCNEFCTSGGHVRVGDIQHCRCHDGPSW